MRETLCESLTAVSRLVAFPLQSRVSPVTDLCHDALPSACKPLDRTEESWGKQGAILESIFHPCFAVTGPDSVPGHDPGCRTRTTHRGCRTLSGGSAVSRAASGRLVLDIPCD